MSDQDQKKPNSLSTPAELFEFRLAAERLNIIEEYRSNLIDKRTAMLRLGVKHAQFHRICKRIENKGGITGAKRLQRGRKKGANVLPVKLENLISEKFNKHFEGPAASIAEVWRQVQVATDEAQLACPSYHTVRRWIKDNKKQREIDTKKLGVESADQIYGAKPGVYPCNRPLEWVQIDHTQVDVFVVDDEDPTIIIGRPWASFAIDVFTRAVIGFHLSLLPPSSVSVALLISNSVLPKEYMLQKLGMRTNMLPMHGIMTAIHTDNAKEFVTDLLDASCDYHGIKLAHRDIGKKHQGGHIERLIGTMMTTRVHFYRGTTYSNSRQRKNQSSEKKSCLTFKDVRELMIHSINLYHGTVHSALRDSPSNIWLDYYGRHGGPKTIFEEAEESFKLDFFPEKQKIVHPSGINILGRRYWAGCLSPHVRERILVKYDPYDTSYIFALIGTRYLRVPCSRNDFHRNDEFEVYRYQKTKKGVRPGTIISESSRQSVIDGNLIQEKAESRKRSAIRMRKIAAKKHHKEYKDAVRSSQEDGNPELNASVPVLTPKIRASSLPVLSNIDFERAPIIYEVE